MFLSSQKLIAHVDMNSYFASVEQQANPLLRGRPLGVCAYLHEHGCIIAASIEAKCAGMRVGMTVKEARSRVPHAVFVQNDPPKYRAVTSRVFSILHEVSDQVEYYSIDEAFLDLTGWYRDSGEAAWAMIKVRRRIRDEVGEWLRCSIGIAPTRFLAKTASDIEKPNGLVIIDHDNLNAVLAKLELEDVCGIGPRMRRRLERLGIHSLLEIKRYPVENLIRAFGIQGLFLWYKLYGIEFERVIDRERMPQSVGHSYCVPLRVNHEGNVLAVLTKLTERVGRRLRKLNLFAQTISVAVGFCAGKESKPQGPFWRPLAHAGGGASRHFSLPANDSFTLVGAAFSLFEDLWRGEPVNFLAITCSRLCSSREQGRLDTAVQSWTAREDRRIHISQAIDAVRDRYGDDALVFGSMFHITNEAPERIGFRKIEGVDTSLSPTHVQPR